MNTVRKTTALFISMGISIFGFSQLNLGLQSTTSAAIHATANAATIMQTTHAASVAAKSSSAQVKSSAQETTGTAQTMTNGAKNKVNVVSTTDVSVSSQSNVPPVNSTATADINNGNSGELKAATSISNVKIEGNTASSSAISSDKIKATSGGALYNSEEIRTTLQNKTTSTVATGEEKVKASSSMPAVSATARAESKTSVVK